MYHCPECQAEVPAEARFCQKCGFNQTNTRSVSLTPSLENPAFMPNTSQLPSDTSAIIPMPTRTVKPTMKHMPARSHFANHAAQFAQTIQASSLNEASEGKKPVAPPSRPGNRPTTAVKQVGLIRPIGAAPTRPATTSATPTQSNIDLSTPPAATPAHLLALRPLTPTAPKLTPSKQFLRPAFLPFTTQEPGIVDISEERTRQEQAYHTSPGQQRPAPLALSSLPRQLPAPSPEQVVQNPTVQPARAVPVEDLPTVEHPIEVIKGRPPVADTYSASGDFEDNFESYVATSKAAEHWRTSWRDSWRSKAGPAASVTRGQSSVPEPLLARRDSLARIRAIIVPQQKQHKPDKMDKSFGFWISIFLMTCLIGGLGVYIASTYLSDAATTLPGDVHLSTSGPRPVLSIKGPQVRTILQGQMLQLHGEHFAAKAPVIFLLDAATIINDKNGLEISLLASAEGTFDVVMPTSTWAVGEHLISALDNKNGQSGYLHIEVSLGRSN